MALVQAPAFPIKSITWTLDRPGQNNVSVWSGKRIVAAEPWLGKWSAHVDLATVQGEDGFRELRSFFAKCKGSTNTFRLPATVEAQNSNSGVALASAASAGASTIAIIGPSTPLKDGQYFTINGQLCCCIAGQSGANLVFEPPLRQAASAGTPVETANPYAVVYLAQSAASWNVETWRLFGMSFDVEEAIAETDAYSLEQGVFIGRPVTPVAGDGVVSATASFAYGSPIPADSALDYLWLYAAAPGTVRVDEYSLSGSTFTQVQTFSVPVVAGLNVLTAGVDYPAFNVTAGHYIGFFAPSIVATTSTSNFGDSVGWYGSTSGTGPTSWSDTSLAFTRLQIGFHFDFQQTFSNATLIRPDLGFGWCGFHSYGQSYSVGAYASPAISTTPSATNKTFNVGPKMTTPGITGGTNPDDGAIKALVEDNVAPDTQATYGETACYHWAEAFTARYTKATKPVIFASCAGKSSQSWTTLSKGYTTDYYGQLIYHVTQAKSHADAAGASYAVPFIYINHGQADQGLARDYAGYLSYIDTFVTQAATDILAITSVSSAGRKVQKVPPVFLWTTPNYDIIVSNCAAKAIVALCDARPDCFLVTPDYRFPQASGHPTNVSQALYGEFLARACAQLSQGSAPDGVRFTRVEANGTALTAYATGPTQLAFNTTLYGAATDNGIKVVDDTGTLTLSGMTVGTATRLSSGLYETPITMTLNRTLGSNPLFRYAMDYHSSGDTTVSSAGGNVFDTTADTVTIGGISYSLAHAAHPAEVAIWIVG